MPASPISAKYQRLISFALRLQADGPRISQYEHNTFQYVGGFRGDNPFLSGWTYDVSGQYGQTSSKEIDYNDALKDNFQNALLVDPTTGNCYVGGSCVPVNIFAGPGGISQASVNYFRENLLVDTFVQQMDLQASTTGDLSHWGGQSPWAKNPISVAIGAEYRQERASLVPDYNTATGNLLGYDAQTLTQGQFDVAEGFGELLIPIIQDTPMAEDLSAKVAYRFSSYDKAGDTNTFSVNLNYQPISDIRFRADYDRSVRAPNVAELFTPAGGSSANSGRDPCSANGGSIPTTAALCEATGVPANLVFIHRAQLPVQPVPGRGRRQSVPEAGNRRHAGTGRGVHTQLLRELHGDGRLVQHQDQRLHRTDAVGDHPEQLLLHHGQSVAKRFQHLLRNS